jgi:hypothetical protein
MATSSPTPARPRAPEPGEADRAIAAAEAQIRVRLSLPTELPRDAIVSRVALVNESPPTVDVEYFVDGQRIVLRQRPAQSSPQFPDRAKPVDLGGLVAQGIAHLDGQGRAAGLELYWTRDGFDYMLAGNLPPEEMARIARSVARPRAA